MSLLPILVVNFVGTLGFSIVLPFLVFLVTQWGGNAFVYGLIGATYSFFQLLGAPILGRWSDHYGRKKILLLSQLGTLVSWLVFLLAFALPAQRGIQIDSALFGQFSVTLPLLVVFVARAADGLTAGNVSVANAYLADITDESQRSRNFGRMAASGNLGFILGPALAGLLGATVYGRVLPVVAALLVSLAATLIIVFRLRESRLCQITKPLEKSSLRRVFGQEHKDCYEIHDDRDASWREIARLPRIPVLIAIYFLVMLGFSFFYVAFPIHAVKGLQWSVIQAGFFFAVLSLLMVLVQGPLLTWLSTRVPDRTLVLGGTVVLTVGFLVLVSHNDLVIFAGAGVIALGNGLMWPSVLAVLSKHAGPQLQGAVQGFASSAGAVASIVGFIAGGFFYGWLEARVFVLPAISIACVVLLAFTLPTSRAANPHDRGLASHGA